MILQRFDATAVRGRAGPTDDHVRAFGSKAFDAAARYMPRRISAEGTSGGPKIGSAVICLLRGSSRYRHRRGASRRCRFAASQFADHGNAVREESVRAALAPRAPTDAGA